MANGTATTSANLNLRSGPGTGSAVVYTIPSQTTVAITGVPNNGWYPVTVNGKTGYVSGEFLKGITNYTPDTTPAPTPTPTPATNGSAKTKTSLNLRSGPGTSSSVVYTIPGQTTVAITGVPNNGWYPVTVNGKSGYVSGDYLTGITNYTPGSGGGTTPTPTPTPIPTSPTAPITNTGQNPFYNPSATDTQGKNWYDTPLVKQASGFDAEYEKYITDNGFGGLNRKGDFARSLADRAKSGFASAQLNNPALTNREYLNSLGSNFLANARAAATPQQRGEQWGIMAPKAHWTSR